MGTPSDSADADGGAVPDAMTTEGSTAGGLPLALSQRPYNHAASARIREFSKVRARG
jgi:hypothetical protein